MASNQPEGMSDEEIEALESEGVDVSPWDGAGARADGGE